MAVMFGFLWLSLSSVELVMIFASELGSQVCIFCFGFFPSYFFIVVLNGAYHFVGRLIGVQFCSWLFWCSWDYSICSSICSLHLHSMCSIKCATERGISTCILRVQIFPQLCHWKFSQNSQITSRLHQNTSTNFHFSGGLPWGRKDQNWLEVKGICDNRKALLDQIILRLEKW